MDCIYCKEEMEFVKSWYGEFHETLWECPNCHAQCDWSEPYGQEWYEGTIPMKKEDEKDEEEE